MRPLQPLVLLILLQVAMCLGWKWDKARREGFREDAPFEELGKGELRGGISERDIPRVAAVAGALCITEVFMQMKWCRAPKGVFGKTQLQKLRDRELCGGISCVVCGRSRA